MTTWAHFQALVKVEVLIPNSGSRTILAPKSFLNGTGGYKFEWPTIPVDDNSLRYSFEVCHTAHILNIPALTDVCLHALMTTICLAPEHWMDINTVAANALKIMTKSIQWSSISSGQVSPVVKYLQWSSISSGQVSPESIC
jgi:hypothetical protein